MSISRRKFIQLSSLASASLMVPRFLKAFEHNPLSLPGGGKKSLVVIQLSGGNDGLNTVIPYYNDIYYKSRPVIGIKKTDALALTDEVGLNPALTGIKSLYDQGFVSIINGVGYPEPNRSHFRSMDIWQSGSTADQVVSTGWLGRYIDGCKDCTNNTMGLEIDDSLSLAMKGKDKSALAVRDINQFYNAATDPYFVKLAKTHDDEHDAKLANYLNQTLRETSSAAGYIYQQSKIYNTTQVYPDTAIGKRMKTIGSLIVANTDTQVYYLSHGSFDTHVNQADRQKKLFEELDAALTALVADLKQNNRFNDTLIMTFSEFGRRVGENASKGTDHGTANSMFMIGGGIKKGGLYNNIPNLGDLDHGDVKYELDFKQVYATVLDRWLATDPRSVLDGKYEPLTFI
jgi:uncharacterized protein (DUF1501 family)